MAIIVFERAWIFDPNSTNKLENPLTLLLNSNDFEIDTNSSQGWIVEVDNGGFGYGFPALGFIGSTGFIPGPNSLKSPPFGEVETLSWFSLNGTNIEIYGLVTDLGGLGYSVGELTADPTRIVEGDDVFVGSSGNDRIHLYTGNDILNGGAGDDVLDGGAGIDAVDYGANHTDGGTLGVILNLSTQSARDPYGDSDRLISIENVSGSIFSDQLIGSSVSNTIFGGDGNDTIDGGAGNDVLFGDDESLFGSSFDDEDNFDDVINGGAGDDVITGGIGGDILSGGDGNDSFIGLDAGDVIDGGAGIDAVYLASNRSDLAGSSFSNVEELYGTDNDDEFNGLASLLIDGGEGNDSFTLYNLNESLVLDLQFNQITNTENGEITRFRSVESFRLGNGDDSITGFEDDDSLFGGGGNDSISGNIGDDLLYGEDGDDRLFGESGDDTLYGGRGNDRLSGGAGNDFLHAFTGHNFLYGGDGDDVLELDYNRDVSGVFYGGAGADVMTGGNGDDIFADLGEGDIADGRGGRNIFILDGSGVLPESITGFSGDENIVSYEKFTSGRIFDLDLLETVGFGMNAIQGTEHDDVFQNTFDQNIYAGGGDDIISIGIQQHILDGGEGSDTLVVRELLDEHTIDLSSGVIYTVNNSREFTSIENVDLTNARTSFVVLGNDDANRIEATSGWDQLKGFGGDDILIGGAGQDVLVGGEGNDQLEGGDDSDRLFGEAGNDTLRGGAGDDYVVGNEGNDLVVGGEGHDRLQGREGNDRLFGEDGHDYIRGDEGDDYLVGNAGNDVLVGGIGDDILQGREGDDRLFGEDGDDWLFGFEGEDYMVGNAGSDFMAGYEGHDKMFGSEGNDFMYGMLGSDYMKGGEGDDRLTGNEGGDALFGEAGHDSLFGREGNDRLYGGGGNDYMKGGDGDDILDGGDKFDSLFGEAGVDTFVFTGDWRHDRVQDFEEGETLDLSSQGTNFASLTIAQSGDDTVVNITGDSFNSITLIGIDADTIDAGDFFFG